MYNGAKERAMSLDLRDETKRKRKVQGDLFGYPSPCTKELVGIIGGPVKIMLPLLGALNIRCCVIIGIPKETIISTTTHMIVWGIDLHNPFLKWFLQHTGFPSGPLMPYSVLHSLENGPLVHSWGL